MNFDRFSSCGKSSRASSLYQKQTFSGCFQRINCRGFILWGSIVIQKSLEQGNVGGGRQFYEKPPGFKLILKEEPTDYLQSGYEHKRKREIKDRF